MRGYHVGAKEGEKRFLRPRKIKYFAIFEPKLDWDESWKQRYENAEENRRWGHKTGLIQEIEADSLDKLARLLVVIDGSTERISTASCKATGYEEKIITINDSGEKEYVGYDKVSKITRRNPANRNSDIIAITKSGEEKKCETYTGNEDIGFIIRHYTQMGYDKTGQKEVCLIYARQQESIRWRFDKHVDIEPRRDLDLKEQRKLGDKINYILEQRKED